jgi:D-lyxose ketol-isomerase
MKRSEINTEIQRAKELLAANGFALPPFAHWSPAEWKRAGAEHERLRVNGLGWDITDFGSGEFDRVGAVIFTLRNGNYRNPREGTPYAEKVIVLKPGQQLPLHFHWEKTEDIINRAGGVLVLELFNARPDETVDRDSPVTVYCDGVSRGLPAGGTLELGPGESITITPRLFHRFWAKKGAGTLVCGEVSSLNDDRTDNCFAEKTKRFAEIEEDEPPVHLLCNEYGIQ